MQHHGQAHPPRGATLSPQAARRTAAAVAAVPNDVALSAAIVAELDSARATDVARAVYDAMLKDGGAATVARPDLDRSPADARADLLDVKVAAAVAAVAQSESKLAAAREQMTSSAAENRRLARHVAAEITAAETVAGAIAAAAADATARSALQLPSQSDQEDVQRPYPSNEAQPRVGGWQASRSTSTPEPEPEPEPQPQLELQLEAQSKREPENSDAVRKSHVGASQISSPVAEGVPPARSSFLDQQGEMFQRAEPDKKDTGIWLPDLEAESELVTLTGGVSLSTVGWEHRTSKDTDVSAASPSLSSASSFQSLEEYEPAAFSAIHDARSEHGFEYTPENREPFQATTGSGFSPSVAHTTTRPDSLLRQDDTDLSATANSQTGSNVLGKAGAGINHMGSLPSGTVTMEGSRGVADMVQLLLEGEASIRDEGAFVLIYFGLILSVVLHKQLH